MGRVPHLRIVHLLVITRPWEEEGGGGDSSLAGDQMSSSNSRAIPAAGGHHRSACAGTSLPWIRAEQAVEIELSRSQVSPQSQCLLPPDVSQMIKSEVFAFFGRLQDASPLEILQPGEGRAHWNWTHYSSSATSEGEGCRRNT